MAPPVISEPHVATRLYARLVKDSSPRSVGTALVWLLQSAEICDRAPLARLVNELLPEPPPPPGWEHVTLLRDSSELLAGPAPCLMTLSPHLGADLPRRSGVGTSVLLLAIQAASHPCASGASRQLEELESSKAARSHAESAVKASGPY